MASEQPQYPSIRIVMKKTGFLSLILCFVWFYSSAQNRNPEIKLTPKPVWATEVSYPQNPEIQEEEVSGGYYQLLVNKQYHLEEEVYYGHFAAVVINESGLQELSTIAIAFDPSYQSLSFHSLSVIRNGKRMNQLNSEDIQLMQRETGAETHIYDGRLTASINLKDIRKGDIIEYSFSIKGNNPIYEGRFAQEFYWQFQVPVETIAYRILASKQRKLHIRSLGSTPETSKKDLNGLTTYSWLAQKTTALLFDAATPAWYDPTPTTLVSEFGSWQEVVDLVLPHYTIQNQVAPADFKKLSQKLFGTSDSKEEQVKKLLNFVQNEIRYLGLENGISAYKPHAPQEVLNQKFGDCKDKSLLFCALLDEIGVPAAPALVNTNKRAALKELLPSPSAFNHCVVQVQLNDTILWFDPTLTHQGGSYNTTVFPQYDNALVLQKDQKSLASVPRYQIDKREIIEYYDIKFKGEPSTFSIISRFKGYEADNQRSMFKGRNIKEIEEGYLNYYASQYPSIESKKPLVVRDEVSQLETEENYLIREIWEAADESEKQLNANFYPLYINDFLQKPDKKLRKMPLSLNYPLSIEEKLVVELPEPWPISNEEKIIENDYFRFKSKISSEDNIINLFYSYELLKDHVPPADMANYLKDLEKAQGELGYQINYFNRETVGKELSTPVLLFAILAVFGAVFAAVKMYLNYDPPRKSLETVYFEIGGWLFLPMLGLISTPLLVLIQTVSWDYFDKNLIHNFLTPDSPWYNPAFGITLLTELAFNLSLVVFAVLLLILLFNRRTSFPMLMKAFLIYKAVFLLSETALIESLDLLPAADMREVYSELVRTIISAAIWVPYFTVSTRVKGTFTVQRRPSDMKPEASQPELDLTETAALQ